MQKQRYDYRLSVMINKQQKQFIDNSDFDQSTYVRNAIDYYADYLGDNEETLNKRLSALYIDVEKTKKQIEISKELEIQINEEIKEKYEKIKLNIASNIKIVGFDDIIRNTKYIESVSKYLGIDTKKLIEMIEKDFSEFKEDK